ncbi:MAG: hypothetical protein HYS18_02705 [Burkholderiales bacterium]|nr:hypothetical protein [Burkholderiales bacterium]
MGLPGSKIIECPKDQWTTLISNFGTGISAVWTIRLKAKGGEKIEGIFIEKRYWWVFPQAPTTGELREQMRFERYWINAIYSLKICPKTDVIVEIG